MFKKLKKSWRSKTILFNAFLIACLTALPDLLVQITTAMPQLQEYLPENVYKALGAIAILGNIVLRFVTSRPLDAK